MERRHLTQTAQCQVEYSPEFLAVGLAPSKHKFSSCRPIEDAKVSA